MEIKTKFNIGDTVYFLDNNIINKKKITGMNIYTDAKKKTRIAYEIGDNYFSENQIYTSAEDIIKKLLKNIKE